MRCTQIVGLTEEATDFLNENCEKVPVLSCPDCGKVIHEGLKSRVYSSAKHLGMFDDGPELDAYRLKDGKEVFEVVQASPWSSGPCLFLCLQDELGTRMFEWSQEEINKA